MNPKTIKQEFRLTAKDQTGSALTSFKGNLSSAQSQLTKFLGPLVAASGAAGFGLLVKNSFQSGDALAKFADRIGVSTGALAGLRHAAEQTAGVTGKTLDIALQRMTRRVADAAKGMGEGTKALKELGLDAQSLAKLSPDKQFSAIAEAMQDVEGRSQQVRLAFKLFDSEGVALVNTLDVGAQGLANYAVEADALGLAISRVDAAKLEAANDALDRARKRTLGWANSIAVTIAPAVTGIVNAWMDADKASGDFAQHSTLGMDIVVNGIGLMADSVNGLKVTWLLLRQGVAEVLQVILGGTTQFVQMMESTYNAIARIIPGLDAADLTSGLLEAYSSFALTNEEFIKELNAAAQGTPPSQKIIQFYNEAKGAAADASKYISGETGELFNADLFNTSGGSDAAKNAAQHIKNDGEKLLSQLAGVEASLLSSEAARTAAIETTYQKRQLILEANLRRGLIEQDSYNNLMLGLAQQREDQLTEIETKAAADRAALIAKQKQQTFDTTADVVSAFNNIAQATEANSERAFEAQKMWAYGAALVNGFAAVNRGWAEGGWWGAIAAAANTAANLVSIAQTEYGDTGTISGAGGGANIGRTDPGSIVPTQEQTAPNVVVMVDGDIGPLVKRIRTHVQRTGDDLVPADSPNGRRLRA